MNKVAHLLILSTLVNTVSHAEQTSKKAPETQTPTKVEEFTGPNVYYGPTYLENKKLDCIKILGPATLEGVTVSGTISILGPAKLRDSNLQNLQISGPLNARKVNLKTLTANGPSRLERVVVDGKITINGTLYAEESNFKDMLSIATDKMTLDHSMAVNIEVRKNSSWLEKPQRVHLTNNTTVKGDIIFEAGNGIVVISKGAVLKGAVKGGKKIERGKSKK
jgi:hypothetical protein